MRLCVRASVSLSERVYVCSCTCDFLRVCVREGVREGVRASMRVF